MFSRPRKSLPGSEQLASLPAPTGGLNAFSPAMGMPPTDCMFLTNMLAAANGLRARLGWREWACGVTGGADNQVRTLIPYTGSTPSATRLFATTSTGIWDVTNSGVVTVPYVPGDTYLLGQYVTYLGVAWKCIDDGPSHASDGLPVLWAGATAFGPVAPNPVRVIANGNVYLLTTAGTTGTTAPSGTGLSIADGTCVWRYWSPATAFPDNNCVWSYVPYPGTAPTQVYTFASPINDAGYGVAHAHTTTAGNFEWYTDEENGALLYTESTGLWTVPAITGVDPADLVFVTSFKGFTLFAERDKTDVWILGVNTISGAASRLGVGYKTQAGGDIVGMWSWTYDGGAGMDDAAVFVTRGGDVLIYQGTDPTDSAAFGNTGVWSVGKMPAGRRLAISYGRHLLLLTRSGIVSMQALTSGAADSSQYETAKIQNLFNGLMLSRGDIRGWSMSLHPEESALVVTVPVAEGTATTQLVMSLATRSWSELRDLDIFCCAPYEGKLYFGTIDGRVCINDGNVDGILFHNLTGYTGIDFSGIGAFQNLGTGSRKQVHLIRPYFLSDSTRPTFSVGARYDFNLTELSAPAYSASTTGSVWDTATWDSSTWGGSSSAYQAVRGASGMGANVALAWRGVSVDRTVLVGFELSYSMGGML